MTTEKRRGRPPGSGIDDSAELAWVADLLVRNPSMTPSAAMKQVMRGRQWRETPETLLRRWQVKWKQQSEGLLATARERMRPRASSGASSCYYPRSAIGRVQAQYQRMVDTQRIMDRQMEMDRYLEVQRILDRRKEMERVLEVQREVGEAIKRGT